MSTEEKKQEPVIATYTATLYEDRSITISAGLAAVMAAHSEASEHDKDCALAWFRSRYIKPKSQ